MRRAILNLILVCVAGILSCFAEKQSPPNFVVIISDDQAFHDFGFMGHPVVKTPHLRVAKYFAMVEWLDETCGELLQHIDDQGLRDDTVVLFICDNGWPQGQGGYRGHKLTPWEQGVRTPIMVRWPGKVAPKRDEIHLTGNIDISQFNTIAPYLARRGMIVVTPEYRTGRMGAQPKTCLEDAKSAMRYVYANADALGIDAKMIAAGGRSAGGHLAAATAFSQGFNAAGDDPIVSCKLAALVLFNPVIDNGPGALEKYKTEMEKQGGRCDLVVYKDGVHGSPFSGRNNEKTFQAMDGFLVSLGYLGIRED